MLKRALFFLSSTFGMVDSEETCIVVMVYNTADSWGVLIGDTVVIPEPQVKRNSITHKDEVGVSLCVVQNVPNVVFLHGLTFIFPLSGSRLTSEVYEWTLLCSSLSTARNKTSKVRSLPPSATSPRVNELNKKQEDQFFSWVLKNSLDS